jgi:ribosomal protein S18 acetylase RimI-like enzyme
MEALVRLSREAIQQETAELTELHHQVNDAQETKDFLAQLVHFQEFRRRALTVSISSFTGYPGEFSDWLLDVTLRNMREVYDQSWPWTEDAKQFELTEPGANYLIAVSDERPIGFVHFRFEEQNNELVLFIYDVQLEPQCQRRGLGTYMIDACEFIAREKKASCVMAMLFKANVVGVNFFENHMKFRPHVLSPEIINPDKADEFKHKIVFKSVQRRKPPSKS